ncbi:MAG: transposase, partial [Caldisericia bacterium]|nr:transposase [Caldisericia bacterium]
MKAKQSGFYLLSNFKITNTKYERWKKIAQELTLSKKANQRLNWIIYYYTKANQNTSLTCRHFGIARSKWYFWFNKFKEENLRTLEDSSTTPINKRPKEFTSLQYERVVCLRKEFLRYGKEKILRKYQTKFPKDNQISSWKIQSIIQISGIYYHPQKQQRTNKKRLKANKKKRISELKKKPKTGYLLCLDTIVRHFNGNKRYILTAIDKYAKIAYARMYKNHSSLSAKDFLEKLYYLLDGKIENLQTDNGSEFEKHFDQACSDLNLTRYYSRVRTPKDNGVCERFNRTLKEEFIQLGNYTNNLNLFNRNLTEWLIEYNFHRPHQTLDYLAPIEFVQKHGKVSKKYSSNTNGVCERFNRTLKEEF